MILDMTSFKAKMWVEFTVLKVQGHGAVICSALVKAAWWHHRGRYGGGRHHGKCLQGR